MEAPVFEDVDPASDCDCPGCVHWRCVLPLSPQSGPSGSPGHPASRARALGLAGMARTPVALALAATAGTVLGAVPAVAAVYGPARPGVPPADGHDDTPQGRRAPLYGPAEGSAPLAGPEGTLRVPATTRAAIIGRARTWIDAQVPYSMDSYWRDGYRQDCSGFVSMAWNLPGNEWTGSLDSFGVRITRDRLQPGDILLFHNPADPERGSHVVVFGGWTDSTHTQYVAYEQAPPHARKRSTPYAYWTNSSHYVPYRYRGVTEGAGGSPPSTSTRYPGAAYFGNGADNAYVTQLGRLLVDRGGRRFYTRGPGPRWSAADRRATQAFQRAQGWRGADADGLPGPRTWSYLVGRKGRDIPAATAGPGSSRAVPGYPGRAVFRPGANDAHVTRLGKRLVEKGFGRYYTSGPGPRWGEADRRNVEAFQRAQGWRGGAADGYPGPETWRRLFS
ncbi:peptidoglycan-binding protein [Streptomyces populi]|uniref:peptidoglycan-binding protein n=1 Tax=Streptomyces populi TaxID=2058924 RepID=UPI0035D8A6F0